MTAKTIDHIITVAIADDHALFRAGVKTGLATKRDVKLVAEADNGMQLLKILGHIVPDVILLDIQMPILDGIQTLPEIRRLYPEVKVIILSMHNDPLMICKLMEIGANSYLTKNTESEIIYQAIRACYDRGFFFSEITNKALLAGMRKSRPDMDSTLTEKELMVLKLMCKENTIKEIAEIMDISDRTVEAIRAKLKTKTGAKSMAGLMHYAHKNNILVGDEDKKEVQDKMVYHLTSEQMTKLFGLSTSILAYVNHDLRGQKDSILLALTFLKEEISAAKKKKAFGNASEMYDLIEIALKATSGISTITDSIMSKLWYDSDSANDFNALFVSRPVETVEIIQKRYRDVNIQIDTASPRFIEIVYPPKILLSIFSELVKNARKIVKANLEVIIKWWIQDASFHCEVHDSGPGFSIDKVEKFVPIQFLPISEDRKESGMGLGIINRTILDSGGHLFFSNSKLLNGALVYFEFPVFDFNPKNYDKKGEK